MTKSRVSMGVKVRITWPKRQNILKPSVGKCFWNGTEHWQNIQKFSKVLYVKAHQMTLPQYERHVEIGPIRGTVNLSKDGSPEI